MTLLELRNFQMSVKNKATGTPLGMYYIYSPCRLIAFSNELIGGTIYLHRRGASSVEKTHPVGMKHANELGLYDMTGNVCEWCQDWYGAYTNLSITNPTGPVSGSERVCRGGGWSTDGLDCCSSIRCSFMPDYSYCDLGLRLVLSE